VESVIFHNPRLGHTGGDMDGMTPQIGHYLLAAACIGAALAWLMAGAYARRRLADHADEWQTKVDHVIRARDRQIHEAEKLRTTVESQQGALHRHEQEVARAKTELESVRERGKQLAKDVFTLKTEREETKAKMTAFQNALQNVKQQAATIQSEFLKSREFYKSELAKAFEKRKALEVKLDDARAEQDSFTNLLQSSVSEKESVNKMLKAAHRRLDNLDSLERKAINLEAENAQLRHDLATTQAEIETLQRDVGELEELKVQNRELAQCVTSLENSRRQYETDAQRYKERAGQSEEKSETLRIKLEEVEKNFLDIEKQQDRALKDARKAGNGARKPNGKEPKPVDADRDNLKEIVGIGKVFEHTLHELGIFTFRQIAAFDVNDVARVNRELKEFRGRMEQDDWIGQAKELHYKKYGGAA
jgi:predicted flap endonuclease-1-like 5' DNA nuclease